MENYTPVPVGDVVIYFACFVGGLGGIFIVYMCCCCIGINLHEGWKQFKLSKEEKTDEQSAEFETIV